jgi:hypothetical protein
VPLDSTRTTAENPAMPNGLTPAQLIAKWSRADLSERAASQEHFIDVCPMLGQPTPAEHDATRVLAVCAATDPSGEWSEDWAELWTDTGAGQPLLDRHQFATRRAEIDQRVLANLLRLNLARPKTRPQIRNRNPAACAPLIARSLRAKPWRMNPVRLVLRSQNSAFRRRGSPELFDCLLRGALARAPRRPAGQRAAPGARARRSSRANSPASG